MAFTVFQLSLGVFALTTAISALPTAADQKLCNEVTNCPLGKEELIAKVTVTPIPHHQSNETTYLENELEVGNQNVIKALNEDMETVTSESSSTAAGCKMEETAGADLGALLDAGEGAMVTLVAGETRLVAHWAVLAARSPVFAAMRCQGSGEASSGDMAILDVEGPVLRQLVAYLYTLQAPQLPSMAAQLLEAADTFGLSALKEHCEQQLVSQLSVETATAAAVLAVRQSYPSLKQGAVAFLRAHFVRVVGTQGWADAMRYQTEDLIEVSRLIAEPPEEIRVLSAEEKGRRLIDAAGKGAVEEVQALLAAGADVGARDEELRTALYWAAGSGNVQVARCLLASGAEVDARKRYWQSTPLHHAAEQGHEDMVRLLLEFSADPNARNRVGWTPLHYAANWGNTGAAAALLKAGADRGAQDNDGKTPLDFAMMHNRQQIVDMLI